jgi:hypothetical protein
MLEYPELLGYQKTNDLWAQTPEIAGGVHKTAFW